MKIKRYTHRCEGPDGPHSEEVWPDEYRKRDICNFCGERLVTGRALLEHIYKELTDEAD